MVTLNSSGIEEIRVFTCLLIEGIALIDFNGRKALKVLSALRSKDDPKKSIILNLVTL